MPVNILVFLLCQMVLAMSLTAAGARCGTGNFTTNSTYGRNRDLILASLSAYVSGNGGFFNGSVGQDPDKVYALGLCRADSSPEVCSDRIASAAQEILATCHNEKEAISWGPGSPPCIVRYTNRSIFGILELDPTDISCNENYVDSNLTQFDQIWENLTDSLVRKASMGSSRLKFASKETNVTSLESIYSFIQCTPDLSQSDCAKCLRVSVDDHRRLCRARGGGYVHKPNCFFRWEFYRFYDSLADAPSPSPPPNIPPSHSTDTIPRKDKGSNISRTAIFIVVPIVTLMAILALTCTVLRRMSKKMTMKWKKKNGNVSTRSQFDFSTQSLKLDFNTIKEATINFSEDNKLGQGGFGTVYKGTLPDGQELAVKRLSRNSEQGELEFKNEVVLMAKLQHRNLVRLIGFCLEEEERLLIYEFVPKSSLDNFIFHPANCVLLNWEHRYKIIIGIARGIHYLHEDSRLRVIHRDLKAENILLDAEMNPKISDFGMAKLFRYDQTHTNTTRVAGTFGYMAPEYVKYGHFSIKSDVYSFGVLVLEIISGKKINRFFDEEAGSLPTYVWKNWKKGTGLNVIDPILKGGSRSEMIKCIHLGLLCVQEDAARRPTMATVVLTLSVCTNSLSEPSKPGFCQNSSPDMGESSLQNGNTNLVASDDSKTETIQFTQNEVSISDMVPR